MTRKPHVVGALMLTACGLADFESGEPGAIWGAESPWSVEEPDLEIGTSEGSPGHDLFRVAGARILPNNEVLVLDGASSELRVFTDGGQLVRTIGGRGSGPEEFTAVSSAFVVNDDSILVFDSARRRLSKWSIRGEFGREVELDVTDVAAVIGRFPDGAIAVTGSSFPRRAEVAGEWLDSVHVSITSPGLNSVRIGPFPRFAMFTASPPGMEGALMTTGLPYASSAQFAIAGNLLVQGFGDSFVLRRFTSSGINSDTVTRRYVDRPFARDELDADFERRVRSMPAEHQGAARAYFRTFPVPVVAPAFDLILGDALGCLWVRHGRAQGETTRVWSVFNVDGGWLGEIELPQGLQVTDIAEDALVGIRTNADGVEVIVRHPLSRQGSGC